MKERAETSKALLNWWFKEEHYSLWSDGIHFYFNIILPREKQLKLLFGSMMLREKEINMIL